MKTQFKPHEVKITRSARKNLTSGCYLYWVSVDGTVMATLEHICNAETTAKALRELVMALHERNPKVDLVLCEASSIELANWHKECDAKFDSLYLRGD